MNKRAQGGEEAELVQMWEGMLGVKPVGIHDNFFDLGGDSMLALYMIARRQVQGILRNRRNGALSEPASLGLP